VPRHHRQSEDHFVLDKLPDVHASGREHAVYLVLGFRDLAQALGKLQFGVNRDGNRERVKAALARQLHASSYQNPQTRSAGARSSSAQMVFQTFGRALHLRKAQQLLHSHPAPFFQPGTGKLEAVDHPRLRHKRRMILCLLRSVKINSKLFRALLHFWVLVAVATPAFAQVYKWVDERGVTHYGERPPQGRKASEVPHKLGTPGPGSTVRESPPPQDRSPQQGQTPSQGQAQAAPPLDREAQDALRRQEQCTQQRDLLARLKQNPQLDVSGAVARQEKTVADLCKN